VRDAIIFSTWSWDMFNVPERISLALASRGACVLYCEIPVSRFRRKGQPLSEVNNGVYRFGPEYLGAKFNSLPIIGNLQWKAVAKQIIERAESLKLKDAVFVYSHFENMAPLCEEMRAEGYPLVHICMDYPEPYQYELIEVSDQTLVIPKQVFQELRARYGEKIQWIPQSIHLPPATLSSNGSRPEPEEISRIPRPRLGYLGPIFARLNLPLLGEVLTKNPDWHFVYFGDASDLLPSNAHAMGWHPPDELCRYVESLDAGLMPYDCSGKKNLYCSPLKLYDYFLRGLPVVSTPILEISEFKDLVYVGSNAEELSAAVVRALEEPPDSTKRALRVDVARAHSTEAQGQRLEEVLELLKTSQRKSA
jgi:hypothetical protein